MNRTVIDTIARFAVEHRYNGFKLSTLRKYVNRRGLIVSKETITRALRALREEGSVSYSYDTEQGLYKLGQ